MSFDPQQFRDLIRRTLQPIGLYSARSEALLMLTSAVESQLGRYLHQINGPALGPFQMEPATHDDIHVNYLHRRPELRDLCGCRPSIHLPNIGQWIVGEPADRLEYDLRYAILMARTNYLRVPEPLPSADDVTAVAAYWKKYWNTAAGAGTVEQAIDAYRRYAL